MAKHKIKILSEHINFTTINKEVTVNALQNKKVLDLEDGLEYYSALESGCEFIITEDKKDFYFAEIEVCDSRFFFETHLKR